MRVIVTGGNSGVGKATSAELAKAGHHVIIACRTLPKGHAAAAAMTGSVEVRHLDLADLASVRRFADSVDQVDVLINNAGVLGLPLTRTVDGFEAHFGTNHLGHFALTCLLADRIGDRVISVSSAMYAMAQIHFDDVNWHTRRYVARKAYAESKLANQLFVNELAHRGIRSYVTDPGMSDSDITRDATGVMSWLGRWVQPHIAQSLPAAARASVHAVTASEVSGTYFAPRFNQWGRPRVTPLRANAYDRPAAQRLWALSAELTGCDI